MLFIFLFVAIIAAMFAEMHFDVMRSGGTYHRPAPPPPPPAPKDPEAELQARREFYAEHVKKEQERRLLAASRKS